MGILSRVESFLERFLEAPAGRLGASIQPVNLAKRIERAMDTNKTYGDAGVIVPNQYDLHLHPSDFAAFASYRSSLEDDLGHGVLARARHERYTLVSTRGSRAVQFDLGGHLIGIGRASDNDVIVDDPMVSRHHCQLKLQHGAYGFTDLGSRNGSTVNGQPVSQVALGPGDVIRIGDTEIEFQVRG